MERIFIETNDNRSKKTLSLKRKVEGSKKYKIMGP